MLNKNNHTKTPQKQHGLFWFAIASAIVADALTIHPIAQHDMGVTVVELSRCFFKMSIYALIIRSIIVEHTLE